MRGVAPSTSPSFLVYRSSRERCTGSSVLAVGGSADIEGDMANIMDCFAVLRVRQ